VAEEAGVTVALRQPLSERHYKISGQDKVVHYWRAVVVVDKGFAPNDEVDEIAWLSIDDAMRRATLQADRDLIARAADPTATPFMLLRHGHAVKRAAWSGDDVERPLDPAGVQQSDELVTRLAAYGIDRVHTSAARRCVQTVSPYADVQGLPVVHEASLTEDAFRDAPDIGRQRVSELLADAVHSGEPTVVCVHRPYLPELVEFLIDGTGLTGPGDTVPVASMIVLHILDSGGASSPTVMALEHHRL
jgi:8-oxo-dGTP diphosphatase